MKSAISKDDLLFHGVHGLCQVATVTKPSQSTETSYVLSPMSINRAKVRFVVPESSMENSGFGKLISIKEATAIMDYFKTRNKKDSECGRTWMLAATILSESFSKDPMKDTRKRQMLERSAKGLVGELAFVLNSTPKDTAEKIQKNLGTPSKINPLVLTALANADQE